MARQLRRLRGGQRPVAEVDVAQEHGRVLQTLERVEAERRDAAQEGRARQVDLGPRRVHAAEVERLDRDRLAVAARPPAEAWVVFHEAVPLTAEELRTLAGDVAPYL